MTFADNQAIAKSLDEIADLLDGQQANPFRVRAYRTAAESVRSCAEPMLQIYQKRGREGFRDLPGIGQTLATAVEHLARTGHYPMLDRLRGDSAPDKVLRTVPTIGKKTEGELRAHLGIHSLSELEDALHSGALSQVLGMGPKRLRIIEKALGERDFDDRIKGAEPAVEQSLPAVDELLVLDEQFRDLAAAGKLPHLAPDDGDAIHGPRPIWHATRNERSYTVVFAGSCRAVHDHGMRDAVTICLDDHDLTGRWTVSTGRRGALAGRRIVLGREEECHRHYANEEKVDRARRQTLKVVEQTRREIMHLGDAQS